MDRGTARWSNRIAPAAALILITVISYLPVMRAGFIWDDDAHITANKNLIDLAGLGRIWTRLGLENGGTPQYYPMTHTMFWVEHHLWGNRPLGYHLINVLLHALSACLLWRILRTLDVGEMNFGAAWMIAAVWAVHPVNVETVAWASERKNVLSGVLFFASILAYLQTMREGCAANWVRKWWGISLALFVAALLSKTTVSVLPVVLLLILWWKRKLSWKRAAALIPFFIAGAALGLLTAHVERRYVEAVGPDWNFTFGQRVEIAGRAIWFYAAKLLMPWPGNLCFSYPRWNLSADDAWMYPAAAAMVLAAVAIWGFRRHRAVVAGTFYFVGALMPALGFFNVYPMRFSFVADHFQYLASVGLIALIVTAAMRIKLPRAVWVSIACALIAALASATWIRAGEFHDGITLWRDTIAKDPDSWLAKYNLAVDLIPLGRNESNAARQVSDPRQKMELQDAANRNFAEAESLLRSVLHLRPQNEYAHFALGVIAQLTGRPADAEREFTAETAIEPNYAPAYTNLGMIELSQNRLEDAKRLLTRAVELDSLPPHGRFIPVQSPVTRQALAKVNQLLAAPHPTTHAAG